MLPLLSRRLLRGVSGRSAAVFGGGAAASCAAAVAALGMKASLSEPAPAASAPPPSEPSPVELLPFSPPVNEEVLEGMRYTAYARRAAQAFLVKGRLVAYTSDVGESVRPVMPPWVVRAAYGLTWMYVAVDVAFHTEEAYRTGKSNEIIARTFLHSSVFQCIASVALPAVIIHQVVHMAQHAVHGRIPAGRIATWLPSVIGLCLIPFLPIIDEPCEVVIDKGFDMLWPVKEGKAH
ncbi:hypothetical protein AB1Y20_000103 [Prymnesium parvum]|uniref:Mitochondrial fission process protein 1 n=1 Tax=Prymnesium parvum TaxID=97485 RepID=A0AB34K3P2_PRYPA